jgi:hypothetical protein
MENINNHKVERLLNTAKAYGYSTRASDVVDACWVVEGTSDRHMLVYAGSNHSATVYLMSVSAGTMQKITQRSAGMMLAFKSL